MRFNVEKLNDVWDEIFNLILKNNDETGLIGPKLNPSKEIYEILEQRNILHLVIARDVYGKAIGYSFFQISKHIHFKETVFATQDVFYLLPEHRGIVGFKFFKFVEHDLINRGVQFIIRDSDLRSDWSRTLLRSGYKETKRIFIKKVG